MPECQVAFRQLPKEADKHPAVWFARGAWSEQQGRSEPAVRCYWEAIRIEPDHLRANQQIASALKSLDRGKFGESFSDRARLIGQLNDTALQISREGRASLHLRRIPDLAEELGRLWEAWAWNVVLERYQGTEEASTSRDRLRKILDKENLPQTVTKFNPALQIDLSHYPMPE